MASRVTLYDLEHVTDYLGFESFCNDLMSREGYKSIQPLGGYKDKGRDAIHFDRSTGVATIFAYSVREDWQDKLNGDLETVRTHGHECSRFVFVSTSRISATVFDENRVRVRQLYGWDFDLYALERIATLVDNHYRDLSKIHPAIFPVSSRVSELESQQPFDPRRYAAYLLGEYELWVEQCTPLLAEHKEMDTYVDLQGDEDVQTRVPVAEVPNAAPLSVLLGESGAGKSTSLWQIVVHTAKRLLDNSSSRVPVIFNLRGWSPSRRCSEIFREQFWLLEVPLAVIDQELRKGSFLVLVDGLNEVPLSSRSDCSADLVNFIGLHRQNRFVVSCRSADFSAARLQTADVRPPMKGPCVYEICRLDKARLVQYAQTYCAARSVDAEAFLSGLRVRSDDAWEDRTSALQLARIPLHLQLFLDVFRQTGRLPTSRTQLLSHLVDHLLDREEARGEWEDRPLRQRARSG